MAQVFPGQSRSRQLESPGNGLGREGRRGGRSRGLSRAVVELLNVRVSQLNGCAYCLDLHHRLAREAGASAQQLAVLPAWRETAVFTETERAALAVGEAATALHGDPKFLAELAAARAALTEAQYSALQWCAIAMNAFNRVSILSGHPVRPRPEASATGDRTAAASRASAGAMP